VMNFGIHQGDAIFFCDHVIEKIHESAIRKMIKVFNENETINLCFDDKGTPLYQREINFNRKN
jgi:hypothetical protein